MDNVSAPPYRSCCPVAICLDILGDKWTLLIIRDLMLGRTRFKELLASPEGIASNTLTERLVRLQHHGIIEQTDAADGTKYRAYSLTEKGKGLIPVLREMKAWSMEWHPEAKALLEPGP